MFDSQKAGSFSSEVKNFMHARLKLFDTIFYFITIFQRQAVVIISSEQKGTLNLNIIGSYDATARAKGK